MELTLSGVGTRLGGRWVVDGIDATPPTGALTGLLGPNGAGKTTLLRLVAGLLAAEAGAVLVDDEATGVPVPVDSLPRRRRARRIALLEQESSATVPLLVHEVVALGRVPYRSWWGTDPDDGAVSRALAAADASHLADRAWDSLSGGERQRVHIARALAQEPELLLLDEPTNHLDISAQLSLLTFVRSLGTTTIAALHDLNLAASFCDHVLVLSGGRLAAAGTPSEVLTPELVRAVYHVDADVLAHPRTGRPVIAFGGASVPEVGRNARSSSGASGPAGNGDARSSSRASGLAGEGDAQSSSGASGPAGDGASQSSSGAAGLAGNGDAQSSSGAAGLAGNGDAQSSSGAAGVAGNGDAQSSSGAAGPAGNGASRSSSGAATGAGAEAVGAETLAGSGPWERR